MQKFSYHSHTNFAGIFDGRNTAEEMISAAEAFGFEEFGISNHFIYHPTIAKIPFIHPQMFGDLNKLIDVYKRNYEDIDAAAEHHKIKVLKGMEVDFFPSAEWRNSFEKAIKELKPDYIIGATHFIRSADESFMCNIYHLNNLPESITAEEKEELLRNYWLNTESSIKSGYFDFIAHFDYCCQFDLCITEPWNEYKYKVVEALSSTGTACEVNTNGLRRIGRPYPDWWLVEKMIKQDIPLLISDDSHFANHVGSYFAEVEEKLSELGCKNRFSFHK